MNVKILLLLIILSACNTVRQDKSLENGSKHQASQPKISVPTSTGHKELEHYNSDTVKYLSENFLTNKSKYVDFELKKMLQQIDLPVKRFVNGTSGTNPNVSPFIYLYLHEAKTNDDRIAHHKNPLILIIKWKSPLELTKVDSLSRAHQSIWNKDVQNFYEKEVVGDIEIFGLKTKD